MLNIKYTLILTVRDAPGVLVRVAQVFARRSANISAIHVARIQDSPWSQMKITVHNIARIDQIQSQLEKLVDVYAVSVRKQSKEDIS
jgi:acetolactate synthase small subunit